MASDLHNIHQFPLFFHGLWGGGDEGMIGTAGIQDWNRTASVVHRAGPVEAYSVHLKRPVF
jgi:hypothetical protein